MGLFDEVCGVQIKCTADPTLKKYDIGDFIQLEDGIYIGHEGWFVVKDSTIRENGLNIYDKWGNLLSLENILKNNPIMKMIKLREENK